MKTIKNILKINSIFLGAIIAFQGSPAIADFLPPTPNPYSFNPDAVGRPVEDFKQEFGKPNEMVSILPNQMIAARDKEGNRVYVNGRMTVKVNKDGTMSFTVGGTTKEKDAKGNLVRKTEMEQGTNVREIRNEKGELLGTEVIGMGGKVLETYDYEGNKTKTYKYDEYGKSLEWVLDELTMGKTLFDKNGMMTYDVDYEGNRIAKYRYGENNMLASKTDVYGNVTYYDKLGNMTQTFDSQKNLLSQYTYKTDEQGRNVLVSVYDCQKQETTYYENGKQMYTANNVGAVVRDFVWDGSKLMYSYERETKQCTWYDRLGRPTYTTRDTSDEGGNRMEVAKWLYYKGRLVGTWDQETGVTTIYKYQREELKLQTSQTEAPSAEQIQKWVDDGLIEYVRQQGM